MPYYQDIAPALKLRLDPFMKKSGSPCHQFGDTLGAFRRIGIFIGILKENINGTVRYPEAVLYSLIYAEAHFPETVIIIYGNVPIPEEYLSRLLRPDER